MTDSTLPRLARTADIIGVARFKGSVVLDVPNELKLEPEEWGKASVE